MKKLLIFLLFFLSITINVSAQKKVDFKLSIEAQKALQEHYQLAKDAKTLKKIFLAAPFAFLFSGGVPKPKEVFNFPWEDYAKACTNIDAITKRKLYDDAAQNCAQFKGEDARFWCKLASDYEKE